MTPAAALTVSPVAVLADSQDIGVSLADSPVAVLDESSDVAVVAGDSATAVAVTAVPVTVAASSSTVAVGASVPGQENSGVQAIRRAINPMSGHRVVFYDPILDTWTYADKDTPAHADAQFGVLIAAIGAGNYGTAVLSGTMIEPSWSWPAPCVLFLDSNGGLTSTPPSTGFSAEIGRAITPTQIMVEPEMPIHLA